jgi:hypothetical protein
MERWNDLVSKELSICPQAYARLQTCAVQIRIHVKDDVKEIMVVQSI